MGDTPAAPAAKGIVDQVRALIARYPIIAVVATSVGGFYAPILKPYVAAVGKVVGLSCQ
jgi:hypothetical protein